jgi:putative membrane protein
LLIFAPVDFREPLARRCIKPLTSARPDGRHEWRFHDCQIIRRSWWRFAADRTGFLQGAKPTDPQIAHIVYTAGQLDIDAAKQALRNPKTRKCVTRRYGARPYQVNGKRSPGYVLNVKPEDNDTSRALTKQAAAKRGELSSSAAQSRCKTYVANEVVSPQDLNGAESTLIPRRTTLSSRARCRPA